MAHHMQLVGQCKRSLDPKHDAADGELLHCPNMCQIMIQETRVTLPQKSEET